MNQISEQPFGVLSDGRAATLYTLETGSGFTVRISDYGAAIQAVLAPDRSGCFGDVVLGYDSVGEYERDRYYMGAVVGRVAGRIAGASFTLDGVDYQVSKNHGRHHLHGGFLGVRKKLWKAEVLDGSKVLQLSCECSDGEDGYPGNLSVRVRYSIAGESCLRVECFASTDSPTLCGLTVHPYFNLSAGAAPDCRNHEAMILADEYMPIDSEAIPTGDISPVDGTPLDFRTMTRLGDRLESGFGQISLARGVDHNFVLKSTGGGLILAARAKDPDSGRVMEVHTTKPGIQFYTGNFLAPEVLGKSKIPFGENAGFCLEPQFFPDAPHNDWFDSVILRPGQNYGHETVFRFGAE